MGTKEKIIQVSEVLRMLDEGMTREEINDALGLNPREIKYIWNHKELRNKRPAKYKIGIVLVNDTSTEVVQNLSNEENLEVSSVGKDLDISSTDEVKGKQFV